MLSFRELDANFEAFRVIFNNTNHVPFNQVTLVKPIPSLEIQKTLRRIRSIGSSRQPQPYVRPDEPDVVAKIIFWCDSEGEYWNEDMHTKEYTYFVMKNGSINFKSNFEFYMQPKMKWATLINEWILNYIPRLREQIRLNKYKEELISMVYSPERIVKLYEDNPNNIKYLTE